MDLKDTSIKLMKLAEWCENNFDKDEEEDGNATHDVINDEIQGRESLKQTAEVLKK